MARPLRIEYPGALYHVTTRGNARQKIFRNDKDRRYFLDILQKTIERYRWICHAFCLMDNHYHLVIETPEANLSQGMRQLNGIYTQTFNRRYRKTGHLFQGRYKAIIVEKDSYLLELSRYVALNPVRAQAAKKPEDWAWSSYGDTAGLTHAYPFLSLDWVLGQFHTRREKAQVLYRRFVHEGITGPSPWNDLKGQIFLGPDAFIEQVKPPVTDKEIPISQRQAGRPPIANLFSEREQTERDLLDRRIYEAHCLHRYTMKEIAACLGVHYATISRAIKRIEEKEK